MFLVFQLVLIPITFSHVYSISILLIHSLVRSVSFRFCHIEKMILCAVSLPRNAFTRENVLYDKNQHFTL